MTPEHCYLDLLKKCLTRTLDAHGQARVEGRDWPQDAETMVGLLRLDNIQNLIENVIQSKIPGDLIETGVWRGGSTILMRAVLKIYGDTTRNVWVADSFEGLPKPNAQMYAADAEDKLWRESFLAVPLETVKNNFRKYNLLDNQVKFIKGFFSATLPNAPIEKLSLLRLDGDMYESTIVALESLYPKLSVGGYVIVDDYNAVPGCKSATEDYRAAHSIRSEMVKIDWTGMYWQKEAS
jgi:O-methyltransferase